jgi:hypothetical protein
MTAKTRSTAFGGGVLIALFAPIVVRACCPAPPSGKTVVNADQTVILIWDAATKTEHFIRKATFKSEADDFGFLIPSPAQPELAESGNEAFPFLQKLTEPEVERRSRPNPGMSCSCAKQKDAATGGTAPPVRVLSEQGASFHAVVLERSSGSADWLKANGYAYSRKSPPGRSLMSTKAGKSPLSRSLRTRMKATEGRGRRGAQPFPRSSLFPIASLISTQRPTRSGSRLLGLFRVCPLRR